MSLIQCPECGHDVSTLAAACPNCGCPTSAMQIAPVQSENTICEIYGVPVDLGEVLPILETGEKIRAVKYVKDTFGLDLRDSLCLVNEIIDNGMEIPPVSQLPLGSVPTESKPPNHDQLDAILGGIATGLFLSL